MKWIAYPVQRTTLGELVRHFGIPLVLVVAAFLLRVPSLRLRVAGLVVLMACCVPLLALPVLCAIVLMVATDLYFRCIGPRSGENAPADLVFNALGICALGLLVFCELFFFDDPYGGDVERMNTVFKFYSSAWFMLHAYAFYSVWAALDRFAERAWLPYFRASAQAVLALVMCAFFFDTMQYRVYDKVRIAPFERGLSAIDKEYPGAAATITALDYQPPGIVLEGQGSPYSYSTHVATLSSRPSYLGWTNHVSLLLKAYQEIERRVAVSASIYTETDCAKKLELLKQEHISYVVLGPLERADYKNIQDSSFSCLRQIVNEAGYHLYTY